MTRIFGHGNLDPGNLINSRASFESLATAAFDGVELDVRRTVDAGLVVIHDPLYGDGRAVSDTPVRDRPTDVVELAAALDLCAGMTVNIEVKNYEGDEGFDPRQRIAAEVIDLLRSREFRDDVLISCFGIECIDQIRRIAPAIPTGHLLLSRRPSTEILAAASVAGHPFVHPYESMVDDVFMTAARDKGLAVNVWTGFDEQPSTITRLVGLGVDGIITGSPDRARSIRDEGIAALDTFA